MTEPTDTPMVESSPLSTADSPNTNSANHNAESDFSIPSAVDEATHLEIGDVDMAIQADRSPPRRTSPGPPILQERVLVLQSGVSPPGASPHEAAIEETDHENGANHEPESPSLLAPAGPRLTRVEMSSHSSKEAQQPHDRALFIRDHIAVEDTSDVEEVLRPPCKRPLEDIELIDLTNKRQQYLVDNAISNPERHAEAEAFFQRRKDLPPFPPSKQAPPTSNRPEQPVKSKFFKSKRYFTHATAYDEDSHLQHQSRQQLVPRDEAHNLEPTGQTSDDSQPMDDSSPIHSFRSQVDTVEDPIAENHDFVPVTDNDPVDTSVVQCSASQAPQAYHHEDRFPSNTNNAHRVAYNPGDEWESKYDRDQFQSDQSEDEDEQEDATNRSNQSTGRRQPLYQPRLWYCKTPAHHWPFQELPDPLRPDSVGKSTVRFRWDGNEKKFQQEDLLDMRRATTIAITSTIPTIKLEDFLVTVPQAQGTRSTLYMDVIVHNADFYQQIKALNLQHKGRPWVMAFAGAPLRETQYVFRVNRIGINVDLRQFLARFRETYKLLRVTAFWALYYRQSLTGKMGDHDFAGIVLLVAELRNPRHQSHLFDRYIDLTPIGGRILPVFFHGRPLDCLKCTARNGVRPSVQECRVHNLRTR